MGPKIFVLDLLSVSGPQGLPVAALVRGAEVMGVQGGALRVCLSRLKARGFVRADARGWYALGPAAQTLAEQVRHWRQLESHTTKWNGSWCAVHLDRLASNQRRERRDRERALNLLGFVEWRPGLALRPNNLRGGVSGVRERLVALGFDPSQPVFRMTEVDASLDGLWDGPALDASYRHGMEQLDASRRSVAELPIEAAAAEAFRVGGRALRSLAFDPLLPPPIVDVELRCRYAAAVAAYDRMGREIWSKLLQFELQEPARPTRARRIDAQPRLSTQLEA
ncbi:MAG: hypothetical protein AAF799_23885 [Myxococcota bacterium]